ncbi:DUF2300 domain-containing protein [Undibacterium pigrum]|uniref:Uncharacterized protein YfaQ (DUF2300 family) n=1 Tax=Undibacterium pigrum TaxID=401470 RepID=A0A318IWW1_9BURK|nr:DUF2300 domain-containing protein [Undibacterium pigrum]PXX39805.1 uncharacterized protein YfaQ (DUF2300 family) [Undibacterium pigrum]
MRLWKSADPARKAISTIMLASATVVTLAASAHVAHAADAAGTTTVAWLRDGQVEMRSLNSQDNKIAEQKIPMGSLWKLFVYAYLQDNHVQEAAYTCTAKKDLRKNVREEQEKNEDLYCCEPGEQVERDSALARSCAPYFSPARLSINDKAWKSYWQTRSDANWLQRTAQLQPDTQISIKELLETLNKFSPQARSTARTALLETAVQGYGREAWTQLGTGIRYKTYSWHLPDNSAFGGAAGWLADGTPFWFGARGSSRSTLTTWASALATTLPTPRWSGIDNAGNAGDEAHCVDVDFFARYPLREVLSVSATSVPARAGTLSGKYRLQFANGNSLDINSNGSLTLQRSAGMAPQITGRVSINDYVARVIDREGDASNIQVARSLAIAARSYLIQNATLDHGCWRIADSTTRQRVSANAPTDAALAAAWFTDDLILQGANVRYHNDSAGTNRMSLKEATKQAGQGWNFERILATSYPQTNVASFNGKSDCKPLAAAQTWLTTTSASSKWQSILRREPGFEHPDTPPVICLLASGNPYSDQKRMRIYARGWRSLDERITLAHEYLHLALRFHPNGANEDYVEKLARRLIEGTT